MSATAASAAAGIGRRRASPAGATASRQRSRPAIRLAAFCALGLYGALRWCSLLTPRPTWRLLELLSIATVAAGLLGALAKRGRVGRLIAIGGVFVAAIGALACSGVPWTLIWHFHVHTIAAGINQGLAALPRVTVPYAGINDWARIVIVLGAAVLLLDAALLLAFAPASLGDAGRAGVALPLIALAVVPSTLIRPSAPYLHGLLLLVLVAALMWGERLPGRGVAPALLAVGAAGVAGIAAAPAFDHHNPWINYESLAGAFSPSHVEQFDWQQRYGPLIWPRTGREMLDVAARHADYWKAEDLDTFDGTAWVQGSVETGNLLPTPDASAAARWTQIVRVTLRGMQTTDMIAAGYAARPQHSPESVLLGESPGTWTASVDLGPGDSYTVSTYSPRPTAAELAASTGEAPAGLLAGYRSIVIPAAASAPYSSPDIQFPPFHSGEPVQSVIDSVRYDGGRLMESSPYAGAYALAQRLARQSSSPYAFVQRVERYLGHGFTYSENAPRRPYPLESFLFVDKRGYCQQFSGAMALLLRMGGVPARVAAGFATGEYDPTSHQWTVTDLDAHSWVEVWFPHYGWVRFDPTPSVAPALAGRSAPAALAALGRGRGRPPAAPRRRPAAATASSGSGHQVGPGSSSTPGIVLLALGIAVVLAASLVARMARRSRPRDAEALVAELERALARCGRPLSPATTLAQLERRFQSSPAVASYIRALLEARYRSSGAPAGLGDASSAPAPPALGGAARRALRARLAEGLGPAGKLRAIWALPPRL